ncbi:CTP synthase [Parapedobacter pyrenivorans]|uniref:CTP synthase n=1 Tax=Parapedobacter pyrenivorans TaxID=1305674 RepID=A0A917I2X0_9SPHI|nr:CTP synthase [Parapedobacter pyrenivorans]GGH04570.1 CTP synthase [Parapedobacter pyrenivorans]
MTKYIFVTGGVTSSLGKGIISASLAKLLQARGYKVTIQKFDPYINIDPGTLNPYEHGECYVTEDGAETDLDLGHYERFLNTATSQANNVTTGRIYQHVIDKEREGAYLGKTVQVVPHITDEIKRRMCLLGEDEKYDIIITELGGTVGDIESLPFIEAVRQLRWELGGNDSLVIHLTLVPFLAAAGELKTKPTQHSVKTLLEYGIQPDILVCRTEHHLNSDIRKKLALFCNVNINAVIESIDAPSIYDVPLLMLKEQLDKTVLTKLKLSTKNEPDLDSWKIFLGKLKNPTAEITIALVGKYVELPDAYKSINEAFIQAGAINECKVRVKCIAAESINDENVKEKLKRVAGVLVAPGFGERGLDGKLVAIQYVREHGVPFFGICLGMQCAVVEFGRNVLKLKNANSSEMDPKTKHPVIHLMEGQKHVKNMGGTMRLGAYDCEIKKGTKAAAIYGKSKISERHRHRYEFNNHYLAQYEEAGMIASGINPENNLVEIVELKNHPFFVAGQFHPELKSTVANPHPLFVSFVAASLAHSKVVKQK